MFNYWNIRLYCLLYKGGMVDIMVYEVSCDFIYDELFVVNGGLWGGENVNIVF